MNILTSVILVSFKSNKIIENAIKAIGEDNLIYLGTFHNGSKIFLNNYY